MKNKNELAPSTSNYVRLGGARSENRWWIELPIQATLQETPGPGLGFPNKAHFLIKGLGFRNHDVKQVLISWGGRCGSVRVWHRCLYHIQDASMGLVYLPTFRWNFALFSSSEKNLPCFSIPMGYVDVSEDSGTPKSSIFIRFSIIFTIHFGVPLFLEHPCNETLAGVATPPELVQTAFFWSERFVGSACLRRRHESLQRQLGVPLTVYPWYL